MLSLVLCFVVLVIAYLIKKPKKFPPGPFWLPIIGCELYLRKESRLVEGGEHVVLDNMCQKWKSDVIGLKLGTQVIVSVSSYSGIKKVFESDAFNARPNNFFTQLRTISSSPGITFAGGQIFSIQKKFALKQIQSSCGKIKIEQRIKEEFDDVAKLLDANETVNIEKIVHPATINVVWSLIAGQRINRSDPKFEKLFHLFKERSKAFNMGSGTLSNYPWLRFIIPESVGYNVIRKINRKLKLFFMEAIKEHHASWTYGNNNDLMYSFITRMREGVYTFTDDQLLMVTLDLFIGGVHSVAATLKYACFTMLLNPAVQKIVHATLDEQFPQNWSFQYEDRHKVPYIQAVLYEVMRYYPVFPIGGSRRALWETELEGYTIPKNATVLINLYSTFINKEIWGDPKNFRPERFLNGDDLVIIEKYVPFGLGRRHCLGEFFARCFLFIYFSEIMKRYEILPGHAYLPSTLGHPGLVCFPQDYQIKFVLRK